MSNETIFTCLIGFLCFCFGFLVRRGLTSLEANGHYSKGKADGIYEAVMLMEGVEATPLAKSRSERDGLRLVK